VTDAEERLNVFAPVTKDEWIAKVEADLKGASRESLRSETRGGIPIEPLYVASDLEGLPPTGLPGFFPFVRGTTPVGGWKVRQEYDDPRPEVCREHIRRDLERGVEGLWLRLGPRQGCRVLTVDDLAVVLDAVDLAQTSVWLDAGADAMAVAAGLIALAERRRVGAAKLHGCFGMDPVAVLARHGRIEGGLRARLSELADLGSWSSEHAPRMPVACVSSEVYHDGGASVVQELAASIATGVEYLRHLLDAGLGIDDAARQIVFAYPVSGDFFVQIAKLRAARSLWARVVVAAGGDRQSAAMRIHARTSPFTKTRRDPWVNMLRATAESTAAVLGGAQSIATLPFDVAIGSPDELSARVARNTQIVLREESHLDAVADPAGGSWFVEKLTADFGRAAWAEFQSIEAAGGIVPDLASGRLSDAIREIAAKARIAVANRRTPIVGVSEFPNLDEKPVERDRLTSEQIRRLMQEPLEALEVGAHRPKLVAIARVVEASERKPKDLTDACVAATLSGADLYSVSTVVRHGQPDFHLAPVAQWRQAEAWERLRDRSDQHLHETGSRPTAFLANLGSLSSHKARSTWAQNLLAAAGIEAVTNDGFRSSEALREAYESSSAHMAVVCGSDADYEELLAPAITTLEEAGCRVLLVAGRPGDREQELRQAGVSDFVFLGANVLQAMRQVHEALGVGR
jgi:methylmalonyl-CoA mutase